MSIEENKKIVQRYQEAYNRNNLDALEQIMSDEVLTPTSLSGFPPGLEGAKAIHRKTLIGMPDIHTEIDELIAEGDKVVARCTMTGTHTGDFFGIPANGKSISVNAVYIVRIADGRIVEHWGLEDVDTLLRQLGVR